MPGSGQGRVVTVLAVGVLALDGALLVLAGVWSRRPGLVAFGGALGVGAVLVVLYWRRHRRHVAGLRADLEARRQALEQFRRDLERHRTN